MPPIRLDSKTDMAAIPILRKTIAYFEEPARGPLPTDIYEAQYWEMAGAHAMLMNGLLNVYKVPSRCSMPRKAKN